MSSKVENELRLQVARLEERNKELEGEGRFGLSYPSYPEDVVTQCENNIVLLKESRDRAVINGTGINHALIEGDNYAALLALQFGYKDKVDMIYIDPPYNKGKDFMYGDKRVDPNHPFRDGLWCNFMDRRLQLARELMSPRGLIAISIDDTEYRHLHLVCDKVFRPQNYVGTVIWRKRSGGIHNSLINTNHEYILLFAKDIAKVVINDRPKDVSQFDKKYPKKDSKGCYKRRDLRYRGVEDSAEDRATMCFSIPTPDGGELKPVFGDGRMGRWTQGKDGFNAKFSAGDIDFVKDKKTGAWRAYLKERPIDNDGNLKSEKHTTILYDLCLNTDGTNELREFFPEEKHAFDYPKPVALIKHFVRMGSSKDSIVLDFFAGTGTTIQAVEELNAEDGGTRRTVLCTNNESNICEERTYPRATGVLKKYGDANNLRYYTLDMLPFTAPHGTDEEKVDIYQHCFDTLKDALQIFEEKVEDDYVAFSNETTTALVNTEVCDHSFVDHNIVGKNVLRYSFSPDGDQTTSDSDSFLPAKITDSQR